MMQFRLCLALGATTLFSLWITPVRAAITSKNLDSIWFVGDSVTRSNADGDSNSSPRKALYDKLNAAGGYTFTYTGHITNSRDGLPDDPSYAYHSGISGSVIGSNVVAGADRVGMTQNLSSFWNSERLAMVKPNVILIMLGTNDMHLNIAAATAPARIDALVDAIFALPGIGDPSVFVATIPPNRNSSATIARVAAFNASLPSIVNGLRAEGKDVTLVDHFTPLNASYATVMNSDNLHPNTLGNDIIGQQWFDAIQARAIPEPGTARLLGVAALSALAAVRRRRRLLAPSA